MIKDLTSSRRSPGSFEKVEEVIGDDDGGGWRRCGPVQDPGGCVGRGGLECREWYRKGEGLCREGCRVS